MAPDSSGEDEPEQLSIYDLLAGAGDEITDDGDGVLLRQPNFNILQIGNPDFVRYDRLSGGETLHPVCPLEESEKWWDEQVNTAKEMGTCSTAPSLTRDDLMRANHEQRLILKQVLITSKRLLMGDTDVPPCHLIVAGTAGTGKTFVLKAVTFLVQSLFGSPNAVRVAAPSGNAASQVGGTTIHSLLGVGVDTDSDSESGSALHSLQTMCKDLKMLQIDERSMVSADLLGVISTKLQKGFRQVNLPFGGLPFLILYGDDGQLPPVGGGPLYNRDIVEKHAMGRLGKLLYLGIPKAVYLRQMVRQQEAPCSSCPRDGPMGHRPGAMCKFFPDLLHRMRFGEVNVQDWQWLQHRRLSEIEKRDPEEAARFRSARTLWLVPTRVEQHNMNLDRLEVTHEELRNERGLSHAWVCPITSRNTGRSAIGACRRMEDFGSLPSHLWLCRGTPVVMTSNICQPWKLFNGAAGTVTDIIFEPGDCPRLDGTAWPRMVLVDFPQYTGPAFLPDRPTVVPVFPKEVSDSKRGGTREMFPIRLGFCLTCHKVCTVASCRDGIIPY